jgi:hypothetical protein
MTLPNHIAPDTAGTPGNSTLTQEKERDFSQQVGYWSAVVTTIINATYLLILVANFTIAGLTYPPPEPTQLAASVVSLLGAPALVVTWICLRRNITQSRRVFVEIGVAFMLLLTAMTCINRYIYLVVVRQLTQLGEATWVELIHPYGQHSIMFAIEYLGQGFSRLACLFLLLPLARKAGTMARGSL